MMYFFALHLVRAVNYRDTKQGMLIVRSFLILLSSLRMKNNTDDLAQRL